MSTLKKEGGRQLIRPIRTKPVCWLDFRPSREILSCLYLSFAVRPAYAQTVKGESHDKKCHSYGEAGGSFSPMSISN